MYRIIFLLSLIHLVTPHWDCSRHSCHRNHHHDYRLRHRDRTFERLAKDVINLDKKTKELCVENSNSNTTEDYSENDYKITVSLPNYKEDNITVKIKHRVLYINAEKEATSNPEIYFEVRVVPEVANVQHASWDYADDKLEITFPYKERSEYATETCNLVIDEAIKTVPKYIPNLDIRMEPATEQQADHKKDDKVNEV